MSLVAAVAVAGLSSTVSAQDLSEAIKGTQVSGSLFMRYDERKDVTGSNASNNDPYHTVKLLVGIKTQVNDDVTFNGTVFARTIDSDSQNGTGGKNGTSGANAANLALLHANFTYTGVENLAVTFGKQGFDTPWTNAKDPVDFADIANGVTASYNAGVATIVGAYFANNNVNGINNGDTGGVDISTNEVAAIAVMAPVGPVNLAAWYAFSDGTAAATNAAAANLSHGFDALYLNANAKLGMINLSISHATLEADEAVDKVPKQESTTITASGKAGPVTIGGKYNTTGSDGGLTGFDIESKSTYLGWSIGTDSLKKQDADVYEISAAMQVAPKTTLKVVYVDAEWEDATAKTTDATEWFATLSYAMSKNFSTYVRYGQVDTEQTGKTSTERDRGRVQLGYKF